MSYPGNPSLAQDVQERISNTFQQTLDLVTGGRDQEALVGCEFILRMDPDFQPAKTLVARLKSGQRPISIQDLRTPTAGSAPALDDLGDLDDLGSLDDLGDFEGLGDLDLDDDLGVPVAPAAPIPAPLASAPPASAPPASAPLASAPPASAPPASAIGSGLGVVVSDLLAKRNFEQILQIAETQKQAVAKDPAVAALVEKAQGLYESGAYVQAFLKSARQAQAAGRLEEAESHLKKARALDPEHPDILGFASSAPAIPAAPPLAMPPPAAPQPAAPQPAAPPLAMPPPAAPQPAAPQPATPPPAAPPPAAPQPATPQPATPPPAAPPPAAPQPAAPQPAAPDDDLMALQQQSLSLESADAAPARELADDLTRDPRQTKPMPAVPLTSVETAEPADDLIGEDELEAELFDDEATDVAVGDLDAELFDTDGEADDDLGAELFDDDASEILGGLDSELTLDDQGTPEAVEPAADGGDRVGQFIAEGQEAFDRGEYQAAIDVWSRIFLIDIDNSEASQLIEEARSRKAEIERQAEELFHEAAGQIESGSVEEAKGTLVKVLELAPSHSLAREYQEQLEAGQVPAVVGGDLDVALADDADFGSEEEAGTPSLEAAVARDRVVVVKKTDKKILALGAAVLVAVLGSGAFLRLKWDDLFPNQAPPPVMNQQARKVDPIERATKMQEGGNTENAILLLERIQPQDPIYEDAQALIAKFKALVEAPPEPEETGPSAEQTARHGLLVGAAREAHRQGRHIRARSYFERAGKILPLGPEDQALKSETDRRLEPLHDQIRLFDQGQYGAVIPALWRKREKDPGDLDVQRLLVDSYYNLALTDLQRGNVQAAARKLREAQEVQPDNEELRRLQLFATTYTQRRKDLLYRIFVKYLPSR